MSTSVIQISEESAARILQIRREEEAEALFVRIAASPG